MALAVREGGGGGASAEAMMQWFVASDEQLCTSVFALIDHQSVGAVSEAALA